MRKGFIAQGIIILIGVASLIAFVVATRDAEPPTIPITSSANLGATVCFPYQGCTGTSTLPAQGNLLIGNNAGTGYIFISSSSIAAGVTGAISTSTAVTVNHFPYWRTVDGGLNGTSTLLFKNEIIQVTNVVSSTAIISPSSTIDTIVFQSATGTTNLALSYGTASRCLRLDAQKNIVVATGDCVAGNTDTFNSAGVDTQILFGVSGGSATSSNVLTFSTSSYLFTVNASSSFQTVSGTIGYFSNTFLVAGHFDATAAASTTNMGISGGLTVGGQTTLAAATSTNFQATNLTITGQTTLAGATSTNFQATNLTVTGQTTLGAGTSTNWQAANLTVTGQTQLSNTSSSGNLTLVGTLNVASSSLLGGQISGGTCTPTAAASIVIDLDSCRGAQWIATQNVTTTFANGRNGGRYSVTIVQDGTGSRLAGWSSSTARFSNGVVRNGTSTASCWSSWMIEFASSTYYFKGYAEGC